MTFSLYADLAVCAFLLTCMMCMFWFNQKLKVLYTSRHQFQNLLDAFGNALSRGNESLTHLQETTHKLSLEIETKVTEGATLLEDLRFFVGRGEELMTRLENQVRTARMLMSSFDVADPQKQKKRVIHDFSAIIEEPFSSTGRAVRLHGSSAPTMTVLASSQVMGRKL